MNVFFFAQHRRFGHATGADRTGRRRCDVHRDETLPADIGLEVMVKTERNVMKSEKLHQELRRRILNLSGVTERQNAGIHEDAFFVGRTMFMLIHGRGHCDIRLPKGDQERVLTEGKARPHRWAPEAGYVTLIVDDEADLDPAMDLIRMSHLYFADKASVPQIQNQ
jgi:Luciferase